MDNNVFEAYSNYYDLLYKDKDYEGETNYIHSLIKNHLPQATTILELGCGTGIHAVALANRGFFVHGIDRSETMLKRAKERQDELTQSVSSSLSFHKGDVRYYDCSEKFDVVMSLFHVMSYMISDEDVQQAFETAKKHLKPNGIFIFDCWYGPGVVFDKPSSRTKEFSNDVISVKRISEPTLHLDNHIVDVNFDISIYTTKTQETVHLKELHSMRYLFTDELTQFANNSQLQPICSEEWLTKKPLTDHTWYACYVFKNS